MTDPTEFSNEEIDQFSKVNGRKALTFVPILPTKETRSFVGGYGNRDISFEAYFKIWLTEPLKPETWQKVKVVNTIN